MSISVAMVEDDTGFAEGVKSLLDRSAGFTCVAVCASAEEALSHLPPLRPQVVLMDIHLPGRSGIHCVRELKARLPEAEVAMFTVFEDYERISQSLFAGASSYLLKSTPPDELLEAIREVHAGRSPMSSAIARKVITAFRQFESAANTAEFLTLREGEVLSALAKGQHYKEAAAALGISYDTVRTHVQRIYKKLHVHTRAQAVRHFQGSRGASQ
jgi:DNA-binding NarL/FixJ family response regulator